MKSFIIQFATAVFALSSVSGAAIMARQDSSEQTDNTPTSPEYPESTDIGQYNGTWYLTGITSNIWNMYETASRASNISTDCNLISLSSTSDTTLDLSSSAFLKQTTTEKGVNATVSGTFTLKPPTGDIDPSAHDLAWSVHLSQVYVGKKEWEDLIGEPIEATTESDGTIIVPGSEDVQTDVYTRLIDSNAQEGSGDSTNYDTIFFWGIHPHTSLEENDPQNDQEEIYGIILSKTPTVSEDVFNRTLTSLPDSAQQMGLVSVKDVCSH